MGICPVKTTPESLYPIANLVISLQRSASLLGLLLIFILDIIYKRCRFLRFVRNRIIQFICMMQNPPTSLAVSMAVINLAEGVTFVHNLDEKYICLVCNNALRPPVLQTSCGHRLCSVCVPDLFNDCDEVMCPGGEEECELLRSNEVNRFKFSRLLCYANHMQHVGF